MPSRRAISLAPIPSAASLRISSPLARAVGFAALLLALRLGRGDPLTLSFQHHFALECSDSAENGEDQHSEWRSHLLPASLSCLERQLRQRCGSGYRKPSKINVVAVLRLRERRAEAQLTPGASNPTPSRL
jgi:hypothetical protein